MEDRKIGYVFAMNRYGRIAIRSFEYSGEPDEDFDEELDSACEEVNWNCVWAVCYEPLTREKISEIVTDLTAEALTAQALRCAFDDPIEAR